MARRAAGPPRHRAFLALGSNLGDRSATLRDAVASLVELGDLAAVSDVFETAPVGGPGGQGPFLNLVVRLDTTRSARQLLDVCRQLEEAAKRVRVERWGPRTLDVDVLWVDGEQVDEPDLEVPHPRMFERGFVLAPLEDVGPDVVPAGWRATVDASDVVRLGPLDALPAEAHRWPRHAGACASSGAAGPAARSGSRRRRPAGACCPALGRGDDLTSAAHGVDLLVLAVPDGALADVALAVEPDGTAVVAHLAGSLGLDVLAPHARRAGLHPLVAMPSPERGAEALQGAWWGVAGDELVLELIADLGGRTVAVADADRARYHAAACIAANHLVALLGQVERVAGGVGVPLEAYWQLVRGAVDDVAALGPAAALTGPVARGDRATVERHRAALDPSELPAYDALAALAERLVRGQDARP